MQTSIIDYKNKKSKEVVNIYDLSPSKKNKLEGPKLIKEMKDVSLTADFNRDLIATRDWFFSKLFRDMITDHYKKVGLPLPDAIARRYRIFDQQSTFTGVDD